MLVVSMIDTIDKDIITVASVLDITGVEERIKVTTTQLSIFDTEVAKV